MTTSEVLPDSPILDPNSTETHSLRRNVLQQPADLAYVMATRKTPVAPQIFDRYYDPPTADHADADERLIAEMSIINARLRGATDASLEALGIHNAPTLTEEQAHFLQAYEQTKAKALQQEEVAELRRLGYLPNTAIVTIQFSL